MKIGIVIGSIRQGRKGESVGRWVHEQLAAREDAAFELLDLKSFDVPLLTAAQVPGAAEKRYDDQRVTRWSQAVDSCDGYLFVTAEYNHSVPGAFKNAFDVLGPEWQGKAVGFVSYGAESGVRAVEHWRQIVANFSMVGVRQQVSMSGFTEFDGAQLTPNERRADELDTLVEQLLAAVRRQQG